MVQKGPSSFALLHELEQSPILRHLTRFQSMMKNLATERVKSWHKICWQVVKLPLSAVLKIKIYLSWGQGDGLEDILKSLLVLNG